MGDKDLYEEEKKAKRMRIYDYTAIISGAVFIFGIYLAFNFSWGWIFLVISAIWLTINVIISLFIRRANIKKQEMEANAPLPPKTEMFLTIEANAYLDMFEKLKKVYKKIESKEPYIYGNFCSLEFLIFNKNKWHEVIIEYENDIAYITIDEESIDKEIEYNYKDYMSFYRLQDTIFNDIKNTI